MPDSTTSVDFFFDPGCPFTWVTSRWLVEAAAQRGLTITARPYSLSIKNGAGDAGNPYVKLAEVSLRALRVFVAIDKELGNEKAFAFYSERGYRNFPVDLKGDGPDAVEVLRAAGIDEKFAAAADDTSLDSVIEESMAVAITRAGNGVGVPIISIDDDRGFFGPILNDVPRGDASGELWDHVSGLLRMTEVHEIKRDRTGELVAPPRP